MFGGKDTDLDVKKGIWGRFFAIFAFSRTGNGRLKPGLARPGQVLFANRKPNKIRQISHNDELNTGQLAEMIVFPAKTRKWISFQKEIKQPGWGCLAMPIVGVRLRPMPLR